MDIKNYWRGYGAEEPSFTAGGNVNGIASMENSMGFSKKLRIKLPYNTVTPFWVSTQKI